MSKRTSREAKDKCFCKNVKVMTGLALLVKTKWKGYKGQALLVKQNVIVYDKPWQQYHV